MDATQSPPPSAAETPAAPAETRRPSRFLSLLPRALHQRVDSLRRDLNVLVDGLAGRHPAPVAERPARPASVTTLALTPRLLLIDRVVRQTADAVTLWLRDPSGAPLPFVAGQFFTLLVPIDGQLIRRAYSACSSPLDPSMVAITCKRIAGGQVSTFLNEQAHAGMTLSVLGPSGNFTVAPDTEAARHLVLLGGGSGITPLLSITRAMLQTAPQSRISLIFGNRNHADIIFHDELEELVSAHRDRFTLRHVLESPPEGWSGGTGRLDETSLTRELQALDLEATSHADAVEFFLCGPEGMMDAAQQVLRARGVPSEKIRQERFASPHLPATASTTSNAAHSVELRHGSKRRSFTVQPLETLLEAGLRAGADMPFSCTMGGCGACKVKLDSGQVTLQEPNCLTDEERAEGYILACVTSPCSQLAVTVELP